MEEEEVLFQSGLHNQAVDCAPNAYPLFTAHEIKHGAIYEGNDGVSQMIKPLRREIAPQE